MLKSNTYHAVSIDLESVQKVLDAARYAAEKHANQKRKGGEPAD